MYSEREKNRIKSEKLVPKNVYKLAPEYITERFFQTIIGRNQTEF